jgi:hypothetical protein
VRQTRRWTIWSRRRGDYACELPSNSGRRHWIAVAGDGQLSPHPPPIGYRWLVLAPDCPALSDFAILQRSCCATRLKDPCVRQSGHFGLVSASRAHRAAPRASPHHAPPCLSHPAARAFDAISSAGFLDRPAQARLWAPARNLAPNSRRIGARHAALVNNAGQARTPRGAARRHWVAARLAWPLRLARARLRFRWPS